MELIRHDARREEMNHSKRSSKSLKCYHFTIRNRNVTVSSAAIIFIFSFGHWNSTVSLALFLFICVTPLTVYNSSIVCTWGAYRFNTKEVCACSYWITLVGFYVWTWYICYINILYIVHTIDICSRHRRHHHFRPPRRNFSYWMRFFFVPCVQSTVVEWKEEVRKKIK